LLKTARQTLLVGHCNEALHYRREIGFNSDSIKDKWVFKSREKIGVRSVDKTSSQEESV
jgi:hypothetical protein